MAESIHSRDIPMAVKVGDGALDPLAIQWRRFVEAVSKHARPENDGRVGLAALRFVERVRAQIRAAGAEAIGADDPLLRG